MAPAGDRTEPQDGIIYGWAYGDWLGICGMTLHLCHPSRAPKGHPVLHIQARPVIKAIVRSVPALVPQGREVSLMLALVAARRNGAPMDDTEYRFLYTARIQGLADRGALDPDYMQDDLQSPITGTVSLVCTCSIAEAAAGRCHRAWAAEVLGKRGAWEVVLDGAPYGSVLTPQGLDERQLLLSEIL